MNDDCHQAIKQHDSANYPRADVSLFQVGQCYGYIKGFDDVSNLYSEMLGGAGKQNVSYEEINQHAIYCLEKNVSVGQIAQMIVKYRRAWKSDAKTDGRVVCI